MVAKEKERAEFSKRLHLACDQAGVRERGRAVDIKKALHAMGIEVSTTGIGKWLNAEGIPEIDKLRPLSEWLKVRAAWLEYEELPMRPGEEVSDDHKEKESNVRAVDFARKRLKPGFVDIPQLDIAASMGRGAMRPEYDEVIDHMAVSLDFLSQQVRFSRAENLALITAYGDSMAGTFSDGDVLLVDRGINEIKIDAVYVLALKDELYIKRIQRCGDGTFLMISDNEKYKPIEVTEKDLDRFQVLARVLMTWNAKKL
ncbi:putative HTH-type transcriptional regulator [compost metagenome]